ncbi:MAG: SagB/ThcOx family dehydrogenase [Candidatus Coatesbacteria bacterium]|nr:MAG: SagB/ThcOx family dehydrogenase [Candidatus Coatesbacteria bacterium]
MNKRSYAAVMFILAVVAWPVGCTCGNDGAGGEPPGNAPSSETVDLQTVEEGGPPIFDVMAARRSVRSFADTPLTEDELARLLWAGQGITDPVRGYKAVPSAGALYPITLYLCDASGVGRYEPETETLAVISESDLRDELETAAMGQSAVGDAPAVVVIVAKPAVTAAKYGGRAERYCTLEAGHVAQNILLAAFALGLSGVTIGAFDDDSVRSLLDLDEEYLPLYIIPLGHPE